MCALLQESVQKRELLLTALWSENDEEIWDLINKDEDVMKLEIEFVCATLKTQECEMCIGGRDSHVECFVSGSTLPVAKLIEICSDCQGRWIPCVCGYELEQAPLSVNDKEIFRRICINSYIGACPHAYYLWTNEQHPTCMKTFCQDRMEDWYTTVNLTSRASLFKSVSTVDYIHPSNDTQSCGAFAEHLLLRLGKQHILEKYVKKCASKKPQFGSLKTLFERLTIWHLAVIMNRTDFICAFMKHKNLFKVLYELHRGVHGWYEKTVLQVALEENKMDVFKMILQIWKKKMKKQWIYDMNFQTMLRICLDKSLCHCKFEFAQIILQTNIINLEKENYVGISEGIKVVIKENRVDTWKLLTSCPGFPERYTPFIAPLTVFHGNAVMCDDWLGKYLKFYLEAHAKTPNRSERIGRVVDVKLADLHTIAVLQNYPEILEKLVAAKIPVIQTGQLGALDYAQCFERKRCCVILQDAKFSTNEDLRGISPLLEVQRLNTSCRTFEFPIPDLISELLLKGYDVNFEDANGITAVQMAIQRRDHKSVRLLLLNGADLFKGQSFIIEVGSLAHLMEVFYCNVDTFDHLSKLYKEHGSFGCSRTFNPLLNPKREISGTTVPQPYRFIAECVNSLSTRDRSFLQAKHVVYNDWLQNKSLQELCRMSLRRHYGRRIHLFVSRVAMPESLKNFILLIDVMEKFQSDVGLKSKDQVFR